MDVFTFVVIVVFIACGTGVVQTWMKTRHRDHDRGAQSEALRAEISALRERVEVLEAIVTDETKQLEREIGRLENQA